jgi:hypothetical protein
LDAVANRLQVITGLTTAVRRSARMEHQLLVRLEGEVSRVVQFLRPVQPTSQKGDE